jgi:hypothetical protein|nr:MAG TPA: hypothetical protein [Caudoviricetes sp.]
MLLRTGEQIESDLFHIFETVELDYEEVEKRVKIDAETIESIVSGNEFSYIKEWLKLIKFVTKDIDYIECSDTIMQIQEDIFLYGSKKLYKLKHKKRSRKHIRFIEVIDYEIMEEDDFGTCLTLSEILMLFEFQNSII